MDEATLRFFEELPYELRGLNPKGLIFYVLNTALEKHLPLLHYVELDGGDWVLVIGKRAED